MDRADSFTNIPKSMIESSFLSPNEFRVCAVLHSYAFLKKIFPAQDEIILKTSLSADTIQRSLNKLEEEGIIVKDQRQTKNGRFSTNEYKFVCGGWDQWYEKRYGKFSLPEYKTVVPSREELEKTEKFSIKENPLPYVHCLNDFLYSNKLNSNQLRVFLYLKQFSNCEKIYPSYATITKKVNMSRPTAVGAVTDLGAFGILKKIEVTLEEGGRGANNYLIANNSELAEWLKTNT